MQRAPSCRQYSNSPRLWEPRRTDQMVIQNYTQSIRRGGLGQGRQIAIDSYNLVQGEVLVGGKLYSIHMRADTGRATRSLRRVRSVTFFFFRFEVQENLLDLVSLTFMKCHFSSFSQPKLCGAYLGLQDIFQCQFVQKSNQNLLLFFALIHEYSE